ncbi:MAG: isoprenyl transferase [Clostridia bacterium]|nr:MAG: isoprenyl transferase [Clostridia bacterium]
MRKSAQNHETLKQKLNPERMPRHVAIIMDGNGRWATRRGMPRAIGHRAGVSTLREIVKASVELPIEVLTVYAFSTENWRRPQDEVLALMQLLVEYLDLEAENLRRNNVQVRAIGQVEDLPLEAQEKLAAVARLTSANRGLVFNLALNYGGRAEIIRACRTLAGLVQEGRIRPEEISPEVFSNSLYTAGLPDPDLVIRPAGEMRLSNFLTYQAAYSEIWVTNTFWPDFTRSDYYQALLAYQRRERRFGGL